MNKYCFDRSEKQKVLYEVIDTYDKGFLIIKGVYFRIVRTVEEFSIVYATDEEVKKYRRENDDYLKKLKQNLFSVRVKGLLGTVLHIDGDKEYMESCLELYEEVGIHAYGVYIEEHKMPEMISKYILQVMPDVVVITGHDFYNKEDITDLSSYKNSENFIEATKMAKKTKNDLIVISGACQSNSEALLINGATYASSPKRINIHTYDPAIIAIKVCSTSRDRFIDNEYFDKKIENFRDAYIGIEEKGKMKILI